MWGFEDLLNTDPYSDLYYDDWGTTTSSSDPYLTPGYGVTSYADADSGLAEIDALWAQALAIIGGATPAPTANSDLSEVDALLAQALGIFQGADTGVDPLTGLSSDLYGTILGGVGENSQTGDPSVDSVLDQVYGFLADTGDWLASLQTDPLTGTPVASQSTFDLEVNTTLADANAAIAEGKGLLNQIGGSTSTSMVPFLSSIGKDVSVILNPNTTDAQLNQINQKHARAAQIFGNYAAQGSITNSINKYDQKLNESKNESFGTTFNHGYVYGLDGEAVAYQSGNDYQEV